MNKVVLSFALFLINMISAASAADVQEMTITIHPLPLSQLQSLGQELESLRAQHLSNATLLHSKIDSKNKPVSEETFTVKIHPIAENH
jgi:hypothetical protein